VPGDLRRSQRTWRTGGYVALWVEFRFASLGGLH